jgi:hypothetical protein
MMQLLRFSQQCKYSGPLGCDIAFLGGIWKQYQEPMTDVVPHSRRPESSEHTMFEVKGFMKG